ncbi:MAG TPA: phosphoribosylamine--glycine ligase [Blastocatellia bacterium]|nr:phosphoribosylamine--glycine ligase [Blastocatellia bacterium]
MKILVIGSGGREHAIAWKLSKSPDKPELYCVPGNAGIAQVAKCESGRSDDPEGLARLAGKLKVDLTFVGPEAPLVAGIAESFAERRLRLVGPSRKAARLEGSKVFAKQFMARHSVPTARFRIADSPELARQLAEREFDFPLVIKADGLAAGKGVVVASNREEFEDAINRTMVQHAFGDAGSRVVIEECLVGTEASLMLFTDGHDYQAVAPARDYKRVDDADKGPNTGGMGSFSTPGLIDDVMMSQIRARIVEPTLQGMSVEGTPFHGILYVGLMLTTDGPFVIEYNARLGDPETQAVLMRMDSDLVETCEAIVNGRVASSRVEWSSDSSVCLVLASGGYPGAFEKNKVISGLECARDVEGVVVFHAGTTLGSKGECLTSGGRVLGVTARAASLQEARERAYRAAGMISFDNMHFRRDIALR